MIKRMPWGWRSMAWPVLVALLVLVPLRDGRGVPLALVPIGAAVVEAGGVVAVADATMTGIATLVGAAAMAIAVMRQDDGSNASGQVRVPTTTLAGSAAAIPAPSAPSSDPVIPAPYSSGDYSSQYCGRSSDGGATVGTQELCSACFVNYAPLTGGRVCKSMSTGGTIPNGTIFDTDAATAGINPGDSCENGYTLSSGSCSLSNARAAVPDNKQDFVRSGTGLAAYAGDDAAADIKTTVSTTAYANDTITAHGTDEAGSPRTVSVQALNTGGSLVKIQTQKVDANGNSYLETRTLTVSQAGVVSSGTNTATAQNLVLSPTNNTFTLTTAPASSFQPAAAGSTAGSPAPVTVQFPSDYARMGEAATAAQSIANSLGPKIDKITETGVDPDDPVIPEESQFDQAFFNGTFSSLKAWQVPAHSSSCPSGSFSFNGSTFVIDSHCQLVASHFGVLQAAMMVVWSVVALGIVLRA